MSGRAPGDNGDVSDIPRWAISRGAKLASLPLGVAGRGTIGLGKRIGGRPAELVASELQARTAEQLFRVLGELKGGAMKFGQALSVFEAALPEDLAGPYRSALTKLQEAAPPMPAATVHKVLTKGLGPDWRSSFAEFSEIPAAAASIGQVHRARWQDGREVAVKLQYPGAGSALLSDLNQLARLARLFAVVNPGLDVKPLIAELKARVAEELDYSLEAKSQAAFAAAYDGDADILVPGVVHDSAGVLVAVGVDGPPLSRIIANGTQEQRDRAGLLFVRFLFSGPARAGLLHADPHPGNFRLRDDGRLAVVDYGAVNRLPGGLPAPIGGRVRLALGGGAGGVLDGLRAEGFVRPEFEVDATAVLDYVTPMLEPIRSETFRFSRPWLRREAARGCGRRRPGWRPALPRHRTGPPAQPAADLPAHPPRHARRDRGALPARHGGAVPRGDGALGPGLRRLRRDDRGHHHSVGRLPSILRTLSRVHVSQRYSTPRAPVCTVQVTGTGSTVVPHQAHATAVRSASLIRSPRTSPRRYPLAAAPMADDTRGMQSAHADEARARWGHTDAFRQSQRKAAGYGPSDWAGIRTESDEIEQQLAAAMHSGCTPTSPTALDLAEAHRPHLSRWFYDCDPQLHRLLADTYVGDERFAHHYDERAAGLASYLPDAIYANADRQDAASG